MSSYLGLHQEAFKQSIANIKSTPVVSSLTILMLALTLVLPLVLWMLTTALQRDVVALQQQGSMVALYLDTATQDQALALRDKILLLQDVDKVTIISKDEAAESLKKQGVVDWLRYLPENPLPIVMQVFPSNTVRTHMQLQHWVRQFQSLDGVVDLHYDLEWMHNFEHIMQILQYVCYGMFSLFVGIISLMIALSLRYIIASQREVINLLQSIGASYRYIRRPYLYIGIIYGAISAFVALILANIIALNLHAKIYLLLDKEIMTFNAPLWQQTAVMLLILICSGLGSRICLIRL